MENVTTENKIKKIKLILKTVNMQLAEEKDLLLEFGLKKDLEIFMLMV